MAKAIFHSLRGEKSALVGVKANPLVFASSYVYIPREALPEGIVKGASFDIPDGYKIIDFVDPTTGEVRTAKDGSPLKVLAY